MTSGFYSQPITRPICLVVWVLLKERERWTGRHGLVAEECGTGESLWDLPSFPHLFLIKDKQDSDLLPALFQTKLLKLDM